MSNHKCNACNKNVLSTDSMSCSDCAEHFHYQCLGIRKANFAEQSKTYKATWKCPTCKTTQKKGGDNTNTPVRQHTTVGPDATGYQDKASDLTVDSLSMILDKKLANIKKELLKQIESDIANKIQSLIEIIGKENKIVSDFKSAISAMALEYENFKKEAAKRYMEYDRQIKQKDEAIDKLNSESDKLRTCLNNTLTKQITSMNSQTYSEVLRMVPTPNHALIIKSNQDELIKTPLLETFQKEIDVCELGVGVSNLRETRSGHLVMTCVTENDCKTVETAIKALNNKNLEVEPASYKRPRIAFKNIIKDITEEQLVRSLVKQNKTLRNVNANDVKIKYRKTVRNKHLCSIVAEVSTDLWQQLINLNKVNIEYQRIEVADESPLVQCFNCLQYGHGKQRCTGKLTCLHCTGEHTVSVCPNITENPKCTNCKDGQNQHIATSKVCPHRQKMDAIARRSVQYC